MYKIDGSELYEYQQQLLQPPEDIQAFNYTREVRGVY